MFECTINTFQPAPEAGAKPLVRYGCKMATGSGKTVLMAMLLAWSFCNRGAQPSDERFPNAALVLCPNLTIRKRLEVLQPDSSDNYYTRFDLVPSTLMPLLMQGKVKVANWHQLAPEGYNVEGGESFRVVNKGEESADAFAKRILGDLYERGPIMVLNDEGHHAYRPKQTAEEADLTDEERKELEAARIWVQGLDKINADCGIRFCVDASATPFYIKGSGHVEGAPFPWLVSDFGLIDAIESGITKIPRIPVQDNGGLPEPKYFNLWKGTITKDLKAGERGSNGRPKPEVVWNRANDALQQLAAQYKQRFDIYKAATPEQQNIPPVMIVVCDNTSIAEIFYEKISGEHFEDMIEVISRGKKKGEEKIVRRKQYGRSAMPYEGLFENSSTTQNTLRVDNKVISETDDETLTKDEAKKAVRELVDTVGQKGKKGEQIKCVVSVQMLTEGWDANNVTHILGLRAFGSQLLMEQVVGRGLRRMNYTIDPETGLFPEEYVDIYGIPFSIIPCKGRPVNAPAPEDKPMSEVRAVPARAHLEIKFPMVEGYVLQLNMNLIKVDFDKLQPTKIEVMRTPVVTNMQTATGQRPGVSPYASGVEVVRHDREEFYRNNHLQTISFDIARNVVINLTEGSAQNLRLRNYSRFQLFPQVQQIVERYLEEKVENYSFNKGEIGLASYENHIIDLITTAIEPDTSQGESPLLPRMTRYRPIGSTAMVNFTTKKPVWPVRRSHLNLVVADTRQWEQSAAFWLDDSPYVLSFVKNNHLEFSIPYDFEGITSHYVPDYIVKLTNNLTVILEIKGQHDALVSAKHQGAYKWVKAVNNWGKLGAWDFATCYDLGTLPELLKKLSDSTWIIPILTTRNSNAVSQ